MENYIQICTIVIKVMTTNFLLIVHYVMKKYVINKVLWADVFNEEMVLSPFF